MSAESLGSPHRVVEDVADVAASSFADSDSTLGAVVKVETDAILSELARTTEDIFSLAELRAKLDSGRKLTIKYGVDVTAPDLHIGHAVNLWMMRRLQDRGHKVSLLIGDFTTGIGDPTGRSSTRPMLSRAAIEENGKEFVTQATQVLRSEPQLLEIRHNSEWFGPMPTQDFLKLASRVNHGHMISRGMFQDRIHAGNPIAMHELLYPILQGWDSVQLQSDLTIVGSDQLFNEQLGRYFQNQEGQSPQVIITSVITPGLDGGAKQSKSLNNYVGLAFTPVDMFGKIMTLRDDLIALYAQVYTDLHQTNVTRISDLSVEDPFTAKKRLAEAIVSRYHGTDVAAQALANFERVFSRREIPDELQAVTLDEPFPTVFGLLKTVMGRSMSGNEMRRLITQGAVSLMRQEAESRGGERLLVPDEHVKITTGNVLKVGKRNWFRLDLANESANS
jgi:tyrosyl-tRNA synthetase